MISLEITKTADKAYLFFLNEKIIKYSIAIKNAGNEIANDVKLLDEISKYAYIDEETVTINGCHYSNQNNKKVVFIGSIKPGETTIVSFDVYIEENHIPEVVKNKAIVTYCDNNGNQITSKSNEVITPVIKLDVCLTKTVDKSVAMVGELLSYYILIRNNSNIDITDVILTDILKGNATIIPASVMIGSKVMYLSNISNVDIGTINAKSSLVITFQVKIESMCHATIISNIANVDYSYTVVDSGIPIVSIGEATSNKVITKILENKCEC